MKPTLYNNNYYKDNMQTKKSMKKSANIMSIMGGSEAGNSFAKPVGMLYPFYLSGEIGESEDYIDWFDTIRNCGPEDVVVFHINSPGGDLFTAIQFMRVMAECRGHIIASVEGMCMSAATIIFLYADAYQISEHSMFMFHDYSSGTYGKGGELFDSIHHERKWSKKLLSDTYKNFLSEAEILSILANKDLWMTGEDAAKRLEKRAKIEEEGLAKKPSTKRATKKVAKTELLLEA